jgi:hypothetical protein
LSAVAQRRQNATVFPGEAKLRGAAPLLYALHRFQFAGLPVMRLIIGALLMATLLWATGALPGGRWGMIPWLLGIAALSVAGYRAHQSNYVKFEDGVWPQIAPSRLHPDDKVEIHATGQFTVEGKYQRLTWLPGFYRTFATSEHALLCLARQRSWLFFAQWPGDEPGM